MSNLTLSLHLNLPDSLSYFVSFSFLISDSYFVDQSLPIHIFVERIFFKSHRRLIEETAKPLILLSNETFTFPFVEQIMN
ncbi:hypothetical protein Hanom_Chr05g00424341 [Helianthus anomalus]